MRISTMTRARSAKMPKGCIVAKCRSLEADLRGISRTPPSAWKVMPTSVVRPSTTLASLIAARPLQRSSWCNSEFRPTV